MPDGAEWNAKVVPEADCRTVQAARNFLERLGEAWEQDICLPPRAKKDPLVAEMVVRMLFSCLVDADRLDAEAHSLAGQSSGRSNFRSICWYRDRLCARLAEFDGKEGVVNEARRSILASCRDNAVKKPGVFTLTVPTGGGKTLSGLAFALEHAVHHGKRRVVVAIPYTSIIDQTATVYENVFGEGAILEHHSALEVDGEEGVSEAEVRRRLASENWDCPLIVTTTVQLFESLLSNRPSRCRKLHNLADSVVIVDEVQALPEKHLGPILDVLHQLTSDYGVTVVLSTATPPDYTPVDSTLFAGAREIVRDHERHFKTLRRVRFEFPDEEWSLDRLREELERNEQALVVLNSRKDALAVAKVAEGLEGFAHLSTLLCGHHRKAVLADVRQRLQDKRPVRLVSTQVVEAGVDLDFPLVLRDQGPLDRIVQAAGRCNREGRLDGHGTCVVFRLEGGRRPKGAYATGTALTGSILKEFEQEVTQPEATRRYTRCLYARTETGSTTSQNDRAVIQKLRQRLAFKSVAETFKMIDQDTVPVIIKKYLGADVPALIASWKTSSVGWFRRVSPFTVNLYRHEAERLQREDQICPHDSGAMIYAGPYDPVLGLGADTPDPADLVG
jgi:CRISPR-associated endonuclease/helicase Cas3